MNHIRRLIITIILFHHTTSLRSMSIDVEHFIAQCLLYVSHNNTHLKLYEDILAPQPSDTPQDFSIIQKQQSSINVFEPTPAPRTIESRIPQHQLQLLVDRQRTNLFLTLFLAQYFTYDDPWYSGLPVSSEEFESLYDFARQSSYHQVQPAAHIQILWLLCIESITLLSRQHHDKEKILQESIELTEIFINQNTMHYASFTFYTQQPSYRSINKQIKSQRKRIAHLFDLLRTILVNSTTTKLNRITINESTGKNLQKKLALACSHHLSHIFPFNMTIKHILSRMKRSFLSQQYSFEDLAHQLDKGTFTPLRSKNSL